MISEKSPLSPDVWTGATSHWPSYLAISSSTPSLEALDGTNLSKASEERKDSAKKMLEDCWFGGRKMKFSLANVVVVDKRTMKSNSNGGGDAVSVMVNYVGFFWSFQTIGFKRNPSFTGVIENLSVEKISFTTDGRYMKTVINGNKR